MTTSNGNENRLLEEAQRIVDRAYQRIKIDRQYRRLCNALRRLGITQIVGTSWCSIDEDTLQIGFGVLPEHRRSLFIEHLVDLAHEAGDILLGDILRDRDDLDAWVELVQAPLGALDPRLAELVMSHQELTVQIGWLDVAGVCEDETADACGGELVGDRTAEASDA